MRNNPANQPQTMSSSIPAPSSGTPTNDARPRALRNERALRAAQLLGLIGFAWVLLDAMFNYFAKTLLGFLPPVNAAIVLILVVAMVRWGWRPLTPPLAISSALVLGAIGFLLGPLLVPSISAYRVVELVGGLSTFLVGYFCLRWNSNEDRYGRLMLMVGGAFALVCVIALHKVYPALFPIIETPWAHKGTIIMRPEVMTDQNFQVFYLMPAILALALPYRFPRFWLVLVAAAASLYVLVKLQTRSGTLVYLGIATVCLLTPLWHRALGRRKILLVPILAFAFVLINFELVIHAAASLIARFVETDYGTGYARLKSFTFLFENIINPLWWVPHGYDEFERQYHTIPHSNITAMFLEGGIFGLYLWIVVFLAPLLMLARMFFRKQLDPLAIMVLVGGTGMLIAQLSLNVPFYKQPWLWAGAVVGTLYRIRQGVIGKRMSARKRTPLVYTPSASAQLQTHPMGNSR